MKAETTLALGMAAAVLFAPRPAHADTLVATLNGYYDVDAGDDPSLHIFNTTSFSFTNVVLTLTGYQGLNNGISQSANLPDIAAGSTDILVWGSIPGASGTLFNYDYDDEFNGSFTPVTGEGLAALPNTLVPAPQCAALANVSGWNYCADTGNFYVTFTAMWNGQPIYAQFSPDPNLPGAGNAAGIFVGWEGLDPNGWSETTYDSHSAGGPSGTLANIVVGTPPLVTPEPATCFLIGSCLVGLAAIKKKFL